MPFKNSAQVVMFTVWDTSANGPKTGDAANLTNYTSKGGRSATSAGTVTEIDATNMPGIYKVSLSDTQMNGSVICVMGKSSTANIVVYPVFLDTENNANLTQIDGAATNGYNANLKLKSLDIENDAGTAIRAVSTGGDGHGLSVNGNGNGEGIRAVAGNTGTGLKIVGVDGITVDATSGNGIGITTVSGDGISIDANGSNKHAIDLQTSAGHGIRLLAGGGGYNGIYAAGFGSGAGAKILGGATGNGVEITGGSSSGSGVAVYL